MKELEERYRLITENSNDLIRIFDKDFNFEYINEANHLKQLGYLKEDLVGMNAKIIVHPDEHDQINKMIKQMLKEGKARREGRIKHKNGEWKWYDIWASLIEFQNDNWKALLISRDITERKIVEQKLRDSEEKYRLITENVYDLIAILDKNFKYEFLNEETFLRVLGYSSADLIGKSALNFIHPDDVELAATALKKGFETGDGTGEIRFKHNRGHWIWLEARGKTFIDQDGNLKAQIISRDITNRKKAEQKLKDSEEKFRIMAEQSHIGILIIQDYNIKYSNQKSADIIGYDKEEIESWKIKDLVKLVYEEDQEKFIEIVRKKYQDEISAIKNFQFRALTKSGEIKWLEVDSRTIPFGDGLADLTSIIDITERKKAELEISNLAKFPSENPSPVLRVNREKIIYINKAAENLFDIHSESKLPRILKNYVENSYDEKAIKSFEIHLKDRIYSLTITPVKNVNYVNIYGMDITDRKVAEQKIIDSEKKYRDAFERANLYKDLFAHDINNLLQIINSSAELISYQLNGVENASDIKNISEIIKKQIQRGAKLVSNVRTLSDLEDKDIELGLLDSCEILKSSIDFINKAYSERDINLSINCKEDKYLVHANELLHDVFDNLLINVMKYNQNQNIEIIINILKELRENRNYIKFEFIDNAIGIPNDKKGILFKEGYRKEKGTKGMGLGLSLVYKIIHSFNGEIWVEDRFRGDYSKGSKFIIMIPESSP
ncbi:MAG: PAS domain S-box protein [Promethearchaeota archaeon]